MKFRYVTSVIISIHLLAAGHIFAQKPVIDTSIYGKWPIVELAYLSDNGEYVRYTSRNTFGAPHITIRSINNAWTKEITGANYADFANNNQMAIVKTGKDSLCLQTLGSDQQEFIPHVSSFMVSQGGKAEWLVYQLSSPGKELMLRNLVTGKLQSFSAVISYQFSSGYHSIVLQQQAGDSVSSLNWLDLDKGVLTPIWQGKSAGDFKFSSDGKGMAFTARSDVLGKKAVWYYKKGDEKARILIIENSTEGPTQGLLLGNYLIGFNSTGDKLFFTLQPIETRKTPDPNLSSVDVYSYKDAKLQSQQLEELRGNAAYTYVFDLLGHKLIALEQRNERVMGSLEDLQKQDFFLIKKDGGGDIGDEWNWNPSTLTSIYLVSTVDGTRKCLCKDQPARVSRSYQLSPNDKYVVYYDAGSHDYYSYTIASGITSNITKGARADWIGDYENGKDWPDSSYEVAPWYRWTVNDNAVFIRSNNDIYEADPSGKLPVIRLTGNYGHVHHFQFSIAELYGSAIREIDPHEPLLLKVLNEETKDEGFCKVMPGQENKPELLKMVPYQLQRPQKAHDAEVYTLQLRSAENSPNQFLTTDFKTFTPLTDNHPEKAYNWMTSQLVRFRTPDGKATQGILFKPENFDPKKKYPVIFEYYERNIVGLNGFVYPGYTNGSRLDIASYVSNGYLVFTPDIYYTVGHPGRSAYNSIMAAAHYLAQFPWVDKAHMGLMGHSFGGFETDYVITHSHLFAAAVSMSGMTDFVSAYGSIIGGGTSRQRQYELYRDRIGATLWERPDLYLENSPVLKVNEVSTPVLLMANKKDDDVPYEQGIEFFTALRRLGKKAWMLQYDNGGHQVYDPTDEKDLSIRMLQFFNHYLKGELPPKWMTIGVPASLKRIDAGLEIDNSGVQP